MRSHAISEVKNRLSELLDQVRSGQSIVVTDRGVPIARIEPVTTAPDPTGRLRRLERAGILRVGTGVPPIDLLHTPGPPLSPGSSAVAALIDERRSGR
jgi:prevent-host-death family protein